MQDKLNKTIIFLIKFSIIMLIIGLSMGFFYRTFSKIFFSKLPMEVQLFSERHLSYSHGHIIIIGFIIPLVLAFITNYIKNHLVLNQSRVYKLRISFKLYIIGSIMVLTLSIYKGIMFMVKLSRDITLSLEEIDQSLFFGSHILRVILYSIAHPLYAFGLLWFLFILWKGLNKIQIHSSDRNYLLKRKLRSTKT